MDRSLVLLLGLRTLGWLRRAARALGTLKGMLLVVAGSLCILPGLIVLLLTPRLFVESQVAATRRYGPLALLAFCLLNVLLSTGERAVSYSPAEVNFLFCGPYRPRQLLLYRLAGAFGSGLVASAGFALMAQSHTYSFIDAFAGGFLALETLYLFTMAVALLISTAGALAFDRGRRLLAGLVVVAACLSLAPAGRALFESGLEGLLARLEHSTFLRVATAPFVPFVGAFTARRVWPDLAGWSALGLAIVAGMVGVVLSLDAGYYEASAAASARSYERSRRARAGAWSDGTGPYRFGLPMLPWWGGAGPVAWRQLTTATRSLGRLLGFFILHLLPGLTILFASQAEAEYPGLVLGSLSLVGSLAFFAPSLIGFDFRPDLGRMEAIKSLPIPASRLVAGQLVTPAVILTLAQWGAVASIAAIAPLDPALFLAVVALAPPLNVLLLEVENLAFLWFPAPWVAVNSVDLRTTGRQILLTLARTACVGIVGGAAAAVGAAAFFVAPGGWATAVSAAWLVVVAFDIALLWVLARAFTECEVARNGLE